jgi:hypothetical protein
MGSDLLFSLKTERKSLFYTTVQRCEISQVNSPRKISFSPIIPVLFQSTTPLWKLVVSIVKPKLLQTGVQLMDADSQGSPTAPSRNPR